MILRYFFLTLLGLGSFTSQAQAPAPPLRPVAPKVNSTTLAPQVAPPGTTLSLTPTLPVMAHQRLTVQVRATTTPAPALADQLLRTAGAAALAYSQSPPPPPVIPEQETTPHLRVPYLSAGVALGVAPEVRPRQPLASAYLQYRFYNSDSVLIAAQRQPLTDRARRGGQTVSLTTTLPTDGYVAVDFVNERPSPVQLSELSVSLAKSTPELAFKGQIAEDLDAQRDGVCLGPVIVTSPPYCVVYPQYCQGPPPPPWPPYDPGNGGYGTGGGYDPGNGGGGSGNSGDGGSGGGGYGSGGGGSSSGSIPIFVQGMPGIMPKQTTNSTCVTSSLAEISKAICNPPIEENILDHWAADKEGMSMYDFLFTPKGGVSLGNIRPLVDNFFNTETLPSPVTVTYVQNILTTGKPIMIDIPSDASGVKHNVIITGFDPIDPNALFYLDPLSGTTRIGNLTAMFAQANYFIPVSGCK